MSETKDRYESESQVPVIASANHVIKCAAEIPRKEGYDAWDGSLYRDWMHSKSTRDA